MSNAVESPGDRSFGYSEGTATWATRYIDPSGFECMLSLQAESGLEALRKAESALAHLKDAQCIPLRKDSPESAKKSFNKPSGATVLIKPEGDEKNPTCPLHGVEMQKWSRNGRTWYSHRWEGGWCNGKQS
ncbi:MAG: hypothetical protein ACOYKH_04160 [Brevefilum fermentans]|jgi:hypothetical protein|uniref:Uncharacterized protein n=1 Tax=Candidatus Brevifilum fermentans TaxID=1986204 RepID=A0A1Y6K3B8_9CHLR|nr:hypothetical protein [Brevefilum fermentans]SMX54056.1 protein of unknown function [Brevefilum fermentans]